MKLSVFERRAASQQARAAGYADSPVRGGRGRWVAGGVVAVVVAAAVALAVTSPFRARASSGASGGLYHTSTYTVGPRQSLTSQTQEDATLGDAGSYSVVNQAQGSSNSAGGLGSGGGGTFTSLPAVGAVVQQGQVLYAVSGTPVVLLYGSIPAYRDLAEGDTGPDVTELNTDLVSLGYVTPVSLGARSGWDYYSAETAYGVELLQVHLGQAETGSLDLGAVVFLPSAIEVTGYGSGAVLGGPAAQGLVALTASSTTPEVTIDLDASLQSEVHAGEPVGITLPDGSTTPGTVSSVSNVATSSSGGSGSGGPGGSGSSPTVTVEVSLDDPAAAGSLTQAPVEVTITTGSVSNALVVPVDALLAEPGGSYAVEVIGSGGRHRLVTVSPGLFDDAAGLVQVTGNLTPGQKVVVPGI
jgi:multidrug efflux pump subunit AcrA (membrane-fusion protein)